MSPDSPVSHMKEDGIQDSQVLTIQMPLAQKSSVGMKINNTSIDFPVNKFRTDHIGGGDTGSIYVQS